MEKITPMGETGKKIGDANPLSPVIFCADPTGIEYEGRLYVYGTNDHQQYEAYGKDRDNTYERIKSLVCFSTADMVNWTYHGIINIEKIAPWVYASWAPSIVSRKEDDGLMHFYLYFSNSGAGVGVITSTSPLGPWTSPLSHSLISPQTRGLGDCPNPFDPGVCIDDNGDGWLAFGGGVARDGTDYMPKTTRIVRLGTDMISLASDIKEIPAPYFFEASELNFVNGTYVYTLNNNWKPRDEWDYDGIPKPPACSMAYMTTKTPLDPSSWEYKGHYFNNPGEFGMEYGNNHTHYMKYEGVWYILYHTQLLKRALGYKGGFRSLGVDRLAMDENNIVISETCGTMKGPEQIRAFNPYEKTPGSTMVNASGVDLEKEGPYPAVVSVERGSWISIQGADFGETGAAEFFAETSGRGRLEVRFDSLSAEPAVYLALTDDENGENGVKLSAPVSGVHDIYILFGEPKMSLKSWYFK